MAHGASRQSFELDVDFEKFRQIMVRKNATKAIVNHGGMELLDEELTDLGVDISKDDRPLLNAIRGESQSEVRASRRLKVRLTDAELEADELVLNQKADIQPGSLRVQTSSEQPAGKLQEYATTLTAKPVDDGTLVTLTVEMDIQVVLPKLFVATADKRVQQAAVDAISEQAAAIQDFIAKYSDLRVILPEL